MSHEKQPTGWGTRKDGRSYPKFGDESAEATKGRIIKNVVNQKTKSDKLMNATHRTVSRFTKLHPDSIMFSPNGEWSGLIMNPQKSLAVIADVSKLRQNSEGFKRVSEFILSVDDRTPDAFVRWMPVAQLGKINKNSEKEVDQVPIRILDGFYDKRLVRDALKTIGTHNLRIFKMREGSHPVLLSNPKNEAVIINPLKNVEDGDYMSLEVI